MTHIVEMEFGSIVYGTTLPTSDRDYKGIYIPKARDIVLGRNQQTMQKNTKQDINAKSGASDVEWEMFSLKEYMKLLLEGQTVALTMLFMPQRHILRSSPAWLHIVDNKHLWLHKGVTAFAGYCRTQANKYGIKGSRVAAARLAVNFFQPYMDSGKTTVKLKEIWEDLEELVRDKEHMGIVTMIMKTGNVPVRMIEVCNRKVQEHSSVKEAYNIYKRVFDEYGARALMAETNEGVDWKACMHAIRVAGEARELLLTGSISYPRPDAEYLLKVRKGELPYKEVGEKIEQGLEEMLIAKERSMLPEAPDYAAAEDFVYHLYKSEIGCARE